MSFSMSREIPFSFARKQGVMLRNHPDQGWMLSCLERTPLEALLEIQRLQQGKGFPIEVLSEAAFEKALQTQYANQSASMETMDDVDVDDLESVMAQANAAEDLLESADDAPIIRLLNAILAEAIRKNASDIHIEPFENQLRIRFRMDGQLKVVLTPKVALATMLVSRIKVMAKLDIAEKRLPQDGRIATKLGGRAVDLRVSTIPSSFGERVVMRLLDKSAGRLNLSDLGLPAAQLEGLKKLLNKPHGILLVTGPTGSGKTTTLYGALSRLNNHQRNIMTVEDPVEYNIEGINQTQVNTKADMTFAKGLRAILRQDPDVVMIGEIRDIETAEIAVQASLTGHLVLSTLHTNTAVGAITRLKDMGVEPFLLSSSLLGVMAQRLVRKLCPICKQAHEADAAECATLSVPQATIYQPVGCDACNHTGYQGRMGVYELVSVDDKMRQMIHSETAEQDIEAYAHQFTQSIQASAQQLVLSGQTSLEEVLRVTQK
ncbi:type II secretion system ATPase GspE [Thiosulfativibrio zosterae]|nr:type II secretion system ATPase GspE [Thiosulfativibrio zosterae]